MKKIAVFVLALCAIISSCSKTTKVPLSYTVENAQGTSAPQNQYIPDSGTYDFAATVKFLSGSSQDKVTLVLKGLPADVTVEHDTVSGLPTYTGHFVLHTNHAAQATYPISIVATAPGSEPKTYNFTITVIPADCAVYLLGDYTGNNGCDTRSYTYPATATVAGTINKLNISNFGGYGITTNTQVYINCNTDSLTIPTQAIGNGTTLSGYGVFVANKMTIWYTATSTPGGFPETCTAVLTK